MMHQINPQELIRAVASQRMQLVALEQEFAMFQLSIEAAVKDTSPALFDKYLWHNIFHQVKHLSIVKCTMKDNKPIDLEQLNMLNKQIDIIERQATQDGKADAFDQGLESGKLAYESQKAKKLLSSLPSNKN